MRSKTLGLLLALAIALTPLLALPSSATSQEAEDRPGFLTGPNQGDPEDIAIDYMREAASSFGLRSSDVRDLQVISSYTSQHNGVTHVNLNQRHQDLEVFGGYATVNVADDGSVVFVGNSFVSGLATGASGEADIDATEAVEAAADELDLDRPRNLRVMSRRAGRARETVVTSGGISDEPIPARLGWQPTGRGLRLAWQVAIDDSSSSHFWNATIDADTGELLEVEDWTDEDTLESLSATLERSGVQSSSASAALAANASSPNPVDDGSSYRVFELPKESPSDGGRTLVTNPADALASPFGWHDTTGTPEPDFTRTQGNNVHAYTDRDANGAPDPGSDPDGGANLTFDFPADLGEHPQTYSDAAVANLFYWNNIIHDVLYLYGFDDPSGNFQVNNYGRGGTGGDDVRAEAQDGRGTNNANFATPALDGGRPRMQMFLWPGTQFGLPNAVTLDAGPAAGTYPAHYSHFTPAPTSVGFAGDFVLVADGSENPTEGCEPLIDFPAGAIALVDRGTCTFDAKVRNAEDAGATAVVVANNTGGNPIIMSGSMEPPVGIPAVMISQDDGDAIKAGLPATGSVHRNTDRPPIRDGDFESGIIIHEYGHGVSNRLTGGPGINCLGGQQRMSEGWSDYYAITMLIDPALDDPDGPRGMGPYALFQDSRQGDGIRPRPYSRDMDIQPATYERIGTGQWITGGSVSIPHGIGHVWAAMLWDMTWNLIDRHGFNPDIYESWDTGGNNLALQLVTDGLKFQGCNPGFLDGRDAIIAADEVLTGGENACILWSSFARRGFGFSAVQAADLGRNGNTEAFDVPAECTAPGGGFVGSVSNRPALNVVNRGAVVPMIFSLGGDRGLDILASNSPASQEIDCDTLEPVQFAITTPTETPGNSKLSYDPALDRYTYPWATDRDWAGTCRQFILTLDDGTQLRANFRFTP